MDINRLACFFHGRFASESRERPEALAPLGQQILLWQESWRKETGPPALSLTRAGSKGWQLTDTRSGDGEEPQAINAGERELLRRCRQGIAAASLSGDGRVARLLDRGLLVAVDDVLLSVVCETDEV